MRWFCGDKRYGGGEEEFNVFIGKRVCGNVKCYGDGEKEVKGNRVGSLIGDS